MTTTLMRAWLIILLAPLGLAAPATGNSPSIRSVTHILYGASPLDSFRNPGGIFADPDSDIIVIADTDNQRLALFDRGWRSRGTISLQDGEATAQPTTMAMDDHGRLFVVDQMKSEIEVLNGRGTRLAAFRPELPSSVPETARPRAIDIGTSGRIYVLYGGSHPGFVILESNGRPITSIGFDPVGESDLVNPISIAVHPDETHIAVVDPRGEKQVHIFDGQGRLRLSFGDHAEGRDAFSVARHATWGPEQRLWITDTVRHTISVFEKDGTFRGSIGGFGRGPGQFSYPVACRFLGKDRILVLERAGARCQVIEIEMPSEASSDRSVSGNTRLADPPDILVKGG